MSSFDPGSWLAIGPQMVLAGTALLVLLVYALRGSVAAQAATSAAGIFAAFFVTLYATGAEETLTFPQAPAGGPPHIIRVSYVALDGYAAFFFLVFLFVALATTLVAGSYLKMYRARIGEFYVTLLLCTIGMMIMASAQDFLVLYLGLEAMSLAAYVLTGLLVDRDNSREAALKYFLMGAFGSALFLYGVAFLYGASGTIDFVGIGANVAAARHVSETQPVFAVLGAGLLLAGFAFKVAAVPFHMWAPDVYHGAPTPISGLMAVGIKAAAFAALMRVAMVTLSRVDSEWITYMLYGLAVLTMAWGNIAAVAQKNIKRLLAYSSIAHAGYLLIAVTTAVYAAHGATTADETTEYARAGILVYMASYAFMTLGAFAVVMLLERSGEEHLDIASYSGLARRHPYLATAMAIFLTSLAGIPPTVGFLGKWYVFSAAISVEAEFWGPAFRNLVLIGVLTSIVSVYYYMRVVYVMFMKERPEDEALAASVENDNYAARVVVFGFAAMVVLLGCFPAQLVAFARAAGLM